MQQRAQDTSVILKFFDDLFDSLNGGTFKSACGKLLKGADKKIPACYILEKVHFRFTFHVF